MVMVLLLYAFERRCKMIHIDVNDIIAFLMEYTLLYRDTDHLWFKNDCERSFFYFKLVEKYGIAKVKYMESNNIVRKGVPYKIYYTQVVAIMMKFMLYIDTISDTRLIIRNPLLSKKRSESLLSPLVIPDVNRKHESVMKILDALYLSPVHEQVIDTFLDMMRIKAGIILDYNRITLNNMILDIKFNGNGLMLIKPTVNIYEYRYKEFEENVYDEFS